MQLSGILAVHPPAGSTDDDDKDLNQLRVLERDVTALLRAKASTWTNQLSDDDHHDGVVSGAHEFRNDGKSMYKLTLWYALLVRLTLNKYCTCYILCCGRKVNRQLCEPSLWVRAATCALSRPSDKVLKLEKPAYSSPGTAASVTWTDEIVKSLPNDKVHKNQDRRRAANANALAVRAAYEKLFADIDIGLPSAGDSGMF